MLGRHIMIAQTAPPGARRWVCALSLRSRGERAHIAPSYRGTQEGGRSFPFEPGTDRRIARRAITTWPCAGCRRPFRRGEEVLDLADTNRVHLADGYACLIAWGERWRAAARDRRAERQGSRHDLQAFRRPRQPPASSAGISPDRIHALPSAQKTAK